MNDKELTFEEALNKLENIVKLMENENLQLQDAINYYKEGLQLQQYCSKKLDEAEKELIVLDTLE